MDPQVVNPPECAYTKGELRLLLRNPNVDLSRPGNVQPVSNYYLTKRAKKVLAHLQAKGEAMFNLESWNGWRIVPANVCKAILTTV